MGLIAVNVLRLLVVILILCLCFGDIWMRRESSSQRLCMWTVDDVIMRSGGMQMSC